MDRSPGRIPRLSLANPIKQQIAQRTDFDSSVILAFKSWDSWSCMYRSLVKEPKSIQEKIGGYVVKRESVVNPEGLFGNHFRISNEV